MPNPLIDVASELSEEQGNANNRFSIFAGSFAAILIAICVTCPSWFRNEIDGLDQAHNVLTSVFFYDFYRDVPVSNPVDYVYDYQRQYPALGFTFWPPLFHAITGAVMHITGPEILTVRYVLAGFTVVFVLSMYWAVTRGSSWKVAICAVFLAATTPVLFQLENTNMLEVPSLAMSFLALWMYQRLIHRGTWNSTTEAILAAIACAAIVYTKQPAVFILPAIALDLIFNHRHLLKERRSWIAASLTVLFMIPLALFTLKYSQVNIAQSIGNQGNIYVEHHQVASRWSIQAWTYYPELLTQQIPILLLLFSAVGIVLLLVNSTLQKKYGVWFWAVLCWYLMFSYFDNKQVRFVAYVVPFLSIIACITWDQLGRSRRLVGVAGLLMVIAVSAQNIQGITSQPPRGYNEVAAMLKPVVDSNEKGNFACFGEDHHLFTAQLRILDKQRLRHILRGDDILESTNSSVQKALKEYKIRWLIVEPDLPLGKIALTEIAKHPELFEQQTEQVLFDNGKKIFSVILFKYNGKLATSMKTVPLRSKFQGITAK